MSNDDVNNDGIPVVFSVLYVGSVIILVNESRIGCGIVTSDGVINVSLRFLGMNGVGVDRNRLSNASSDGTLPICCCYRGGESRPMIYYSRRIDEIRDIHPTYKHNNTHTDTYKLTIDLHPSNINHSLDKFTTILINITKQRYNQLFKEWHSLTNATIIV